jgi:hypothetical protein
MRVLIVAFYFPPSNVVCAIRVGKVVRYLDRRGYDIRVLTTDIADDRACRFAMAGEEARPITLVAAAMMKDYRAIRTLGPRNRELASREARWASTRH